MMNKFFKSVSLSVIAAFFAAPSFAQVGVFTGEASIGTDGGLGEASFSDGTYEILASGDDIWNTADGMYWVYQEVSGNFRATASMEWGPTEIPGGDNPNDWRKMGIMLRGIAEDASSNYVYAMLRSDLGATLQSRPVPGESAVGTPLVGKADGETDTVQLLRVGNTFTMFRFLEDGSTVTIGSTTIPDFPSDAFIGLAVTAHDTNALERAFFSDVSIEAVEGVGSTVSRDAGDVAVVKSGDTIPITLTVGVEEGQTADLTVTETLPADWTASNLVASAGSASADGNVITWDIPGASGDEITLNYEANVAGSGGSLNIGGGVNNGFETFGTGGDSGFFVLGESDGFGIFDSSMDIVDPANPDNLGAEGASVFDADTNTYTIVGSGNDIWNQADNFHFLFRQVPIDVPVSLKATVELDPMNGEQTWAKAGPMIRDDLDAAASHVFSMIRAGGRDFAPQWRATFGGNGAWDGDPSLVFGGDGAGEQNGTVEIERIPETNETIFYYFDAATGERVQSMVRTDIEFLGSLDDASQYFIGLAVTSHSVGIISSAVFSDVTLKIGDETFGEPSSDVVEWSLY